MNESVFFQTPFLRTSRNFPIESKKLEIELNSAYIEIAGAVNARTIGVFPTNNPVVTGEIWYTNNRSSGELRSARQQSLRKIYVFGAIAPGATLNIPVGYNNFESFARITGEVITNVVDYRPLPYVDPVTLTNGMSIRVGTVAGSLQIIIVVGATAPAVTSGIAVLEFLSQV